MIKKHIQTLTVEHGDASNCYQTTLACLLNVEPWMVPNFALFDKQEKWMEIVQYWLRGNHSVLETPSTILHEFHTGKVNDFPIAFRDVPYMVTGRCVNNPDMFHVVIYMNGEQLHDTYPNGMPIELTEESEFSYLQKT